MQFRPFPAATGGFFLENKFAPGQLERSDLRCCVLILGRNTGEAYDAVDYTACNISVTIAQLHIGLAPRSF
jgi:hypothetical protein